MIPGKTCTFTPGEVASLLLALDAREEQLSDLIADKTGDYSDIDRAAARVNLRKLAALRARLGGR